MTLASKAFQMVGKLLPTDGQGRHSIGLHWPVTNQDLPRYLFNTPWIFSDL